MNCNICQHKLGQPVYQSTENRVLTSLCEVINVSSFVYFCDQCGHCYTPPVQDLSEYYSEDYKILIESEEEDQIVFFPDGRKTLRFDLQVENFNNKISLSKNTKLLDFGCAKSTTIKRLCQQSKELIPHLFDVSDMYLPFWKTFVSSDNWATHQPKPAWKNYFDVVTSFFSLEHVAEPDQMIETINHLLIDGGIFYCVVPDMYCNTADFVVADHVNHFSSSSLIYLLKNKGFDNIEIDTDSHYGAFIVTATKVENYKKDSVAMPDRETVQKIVSKLKVIAEYWSRISNEISQFESTYSNNEAVAIYGSGFYGAFIASCLKRFDQVECFIDQNVFRQSQKLFDRPICSPENLPDNIRYIHVGLNPSTAKKSISDIEMWKSQQHIYNYL